MEQLLDRAGPLPRPNGLIMQKQRPPSRSGVSPLGKWWNFIRCLPLTLVHADWFVVADWSLVTMSNTTFWQKVKKKTLQKMTFLLQNQCWLGRAVPARTQFQWRRNLASFRLLWGLSSGASPSASPDLTLC